jgi:hypothetical protein
LASRSSLWPWTFFSAIASVKGWIERRGAIRRSCRCRTFSQVAVRTIKFIVQRCRPARVNSTQVRPWPLDHEGQDRRRPLDLLPAARHSLDLVNAPFTLVLSAGDGAWRQLDTKALSPTSFVFSCPHGMSVRSEQ